MYLIIGQIAIRTWRTSKLKSRPTVRRLPPRPHLPLLTPTIKHHLLPKQGHLRKKVKIFVLLHKSVNSFKLWYTWMMNDALSITCSDQVWIYQDEIRWSIWAEDDFNLTIDTWLLQSLSIEPLPFIRLWQIKINFSRSEIANYKSPVLKTLKKIPDNTQNLIL